ncbi:Uncharacterised protein [Edwardsiella tarda]|nr:Uncharacterised protein [Edwardsiella tarda]
MLFAVQIARDAAFPYAGYSGYITNRWRDTVILSVGATFSIWEAYKTMVR